MRRVRGLVGLSALVVAASACDAISGVGDLVFVADDGGADDGGATCAGTAYDTANCGAYGHACARDETCWEGACVASTCGARGWSEVESPGPFSGTVLDVAFVAGPSPGKGWATRTLGGDMSTTTNGGASWTTEPNDVGSCADMYRVQSPDGVNVFSGGAGSCFRKSTDGGATWQKAILVPHGSHLNGGLHFWDADVGVIFPYQLPPVRTTDGGATWKVVGSGPVTPGWNRPIPVPGAPSWLYYAVSASGHGGGSTFWRSTDLGATWTSASMDGAPADFVPTSGAFVSIDVGWIADIEGQMMATTDSGATWTILPGVPLVMTWGAIAFRDEKHGLAVGTSGAVGAIYATSDGGLTWTGQTTPDVAPVTSVWLSANGWAFASCSTSGQVVRYCP